MLVSFFQEYLRELQTDPLMKTYTMVMIIVGPLLVYDYAKEIVLKYKRKQKLNKKRA